MIETLIEHLKSQNNTLDSVNTNIKSMNSSLATMILSDRKDELRRREADDDAKRAASAASRTRGTAGGGSKKGGGSRFAGLGGALSGFGAGALASGATGLLGRAGLAVGLNVGADSISNYVQEQTGSSDLGDAAHRAAKLGSFGVLLGKRFAVLGAVGGAIASPEVVSELDKLGDKAAGLKDPLMKFAGALPSLNQVLSKTTETVAGTLGLINSVVAGDVPAALDNLDEAAVLALGVKGGMNADKNRQKLTRAGRRAAQKTAAAIKAKKLTSPVSQVEFSKTQRQQFNSETAKGLSNKKIKALELDGLKVDKTTGSISKVGGGFVSAAEVDEKFAKNKIKTSTKSLGAKNFVDELNGKAAAKFGRFGKALSFLKKVPVLGSLISGGIIANILMNDATSTEEKAALLSKELGSIGGAALGGALGGLIGTTALPGIGTITGGVLGALGGAISGEALGEQFANWMLGTGDSTSEPVSSAGGNKKRQRGAGAKPSQVSSSVTSAPYPQSGVKVATASSDMFAAQAQQNIVVVDNSNVSNNVSTQAGDVSFSGTTGFDFYDPMMGSRTA